MMKLSDLRKRLDDLASKKKLSAKECALLLDAVCFLDFIDAFETTENAVQFAAADREGRVVVLPELPKCDKRNGKFCGKKMDCTFVCETAAEHFHPTEEESEAAAALAEKGE